MTSSLAAVYNTDLSRVQLTLTGADGAWLVERSINQLLWTTVRGGMGLAVAGGSATLDDFEFAADVINYYRARPIDLERLMETFTSSGTWSKPANLVAVRVRVQAPGGAGGGAATTAAGESSAGSGGNAGGYAEAIIPAASLGATETVTINAAGVGSAGANGGNAGSASFGAHVVATGGQGGAIGTASTATIPTTSSGTPGAGSTGDLLVTGGQGGFGFRSPTLPRGGTGGAGALGGGASNTAGNSDGSAGTAYGSGGSGASNGASQVTARAGGNGAPGVVIVENIFWPPDA